MGWQNRDRYELHLTRRDGKKMRHQPQPVIEEFELDRELDQVVGKHFVWMAAAAEQIDLNPHRRVREMQNWLPQYQIEVWRAKGHWKAPEAVSTSTHGWRD